MAEAIQSGEHTPLSSSRGQRPSKKSPSDTHPERRNEQTLFSHSSGFKICNGDFSAIKGSRYGPLKIVINQGHSYRPGRPPSDSTSDSSSSIPSTIAEPSRSPNCGNGDTSPTTGSDGFRSSGTECLQPPQPQTPSPRTWSKFETVSSSSTRVEEEFIKVDELSEQIAFWRVKQQDLKSREETLDLREMQVEFREEALDRVEYRLSEMRAELLSREYYLKRELQDLQSREKMFKAEKEAFRILQQKNATSGTLSANDIISPSVDSSPIRGGQASAPLSPASSPPSRAGRNNGSPGTVKPRRAVRTPQPCGPRTRPPPLPPLTIPETGDFLRVLGSDTVTFPDSCQTAVDPGFAPTNLLLEGESKGCDRQGGKYQLDFSPIHSIDPHKDPAPSTEAVGCGFPNTSLIYFHGIGHEAHTNSMGPLTPNSSSESSDSSSDTFDCARSVRSIRTKDKMSGTGIAWLVETLIHTGITDADGLVTTLCEKVEDERSATAAVQAIQKQIQENRQPLNQLHAIRLLAIMLQRRVSTFRYRACCPSFLKALDTMISSRETNPVVQERLLDVISAAAYSASLLASSDALAALWLRVRPLDKPDRGEPLDSDYLGISFNSVSGSYRFGIGQAI